MSDKRSSRRNNEGSRKDADSRSGKDDSRSSNSREDRDDNDSFGGSDHDSMNRSYSNSSNYDDYGSGERGMGRDRDSQQNSGRGHGGDHKRSGGQGRSQGSWSSQGGRGSQGPQNWSGNDRYAGRDGGSNQFSSWESNPSDMQGHSGRREQSSQWGSQGGMQHGMQRGQHAGRGPKGYRRGDERITDDVNEGLTQDSHVDASDIEVSVSNGEVTLTGTVDSRDAKRHAEDVIERVSGVSEVHNQIRVSKSGASQSGTKSGSSNKTTGKSGDRTDG